MTTITITMNGSNKYQVELDPNGAHQVHVVKHRGRRRGAEPRQYLSVIKPGSPNWKRAVRLAKEQQLNLTVPAGVEHLDDALILHWLEGATKALGTADAAKPALAEFMKRTFSKSKMTKRQALELIEQASSSRGETR
jgi:hypothetical protein